MLRIIRATVCPFIHRYYCQASLTNTSNHQKVLTGTNVQLRGNLFRIIKQDSWKLLHYNVSFNPDVLTKGEKLYIIRNSIGDEDIFYHYNGSDSLFTVTKLPQTKFNTQVVSSAVPIKVSLDSDEIFDFNSPISIKFLNILIRRIFLRERMLCIDNMYFHPDFSVNMESTNLRVLRGISKRIFKGENGNLFLSITQRHKFISRLSVHELIRSHLISNDYAYIENLLLGRKIITGYNHRSYTIVSIDFKSSPKMFTFSEGEQNCVDYYQSKYGLDIEHRDQPLLLCQTNPNADYVHLIPEFCYFIGFSDDLKSNNMAIKERMKLTRIKPAEMANVLKDFVESMTSNSETRKDFDKWGINIDGKLTDIPSRILPSIDIISTRKLEVTPKPNCVVDWHGPLGLSKMSKVTSMGAMTILSPDYLKRDVATFVEILENRLSFWRSGIDRIDYLYYSRNEIEKIGEKLRQFKANDFVLSFIPPTLYTSIKKITLCDFGVPSQNITQYILKSLPDNKFSRFIFDKISIQMLTKSGSIPWKIVIPPELLNSIGDTMFAGYHNLSVPCGKGFINAMVHTLDAEASEYKNSCFHSKTSDVLSDVIYNLKYAMSNWRQRNRGKNPENIVIYYSGIKGVEIINKMCQKIIDHVGNTKVQFTVVKRCDDMRFMRCSGGEYDNPSVGTVVDELITTPGRFEYFLLTSLPLMGNLATPIHYDVIHDGTDFGADVTQRLTHALSHGYYNKTSSYAVPAPCEYAHKLAAMSSLVNKKFSDRLSSKHFYL